jgi:hypothetical protein
MVTMFMFFREQIQFPAPITGDGRFQPPLSDSSMHRLRSRN